MAKSEASVSILMIEAIKFKLITCNFKSKRKRSKRHQFTFRWRGKMIKEKDPEVMNS